MDTSPSPARIAHEVNNALAVIGTLTELLLQDRPADDPSRADLEEIRDATHRAAASMRLLDTGASEAAASLTADPPRAPSSTILVVDPDPASRGDLRRSLVRAGFAVIDTSSWQEASSLRSGGLRPHLVVSSEAPEEQDIDVPSGDELPHIRLTPAGKGGVLDALDDLIVEIRRRLTTDGGPS